MAMQITTNPQILGLALIGGMIPSLLWLWFWLREDKKNPEPKSLLAIVFIMGMVGVICVRPIQELIQNVFTSHELQLILWASAEEVMKFIAVLLILYKTHEVDEPIDWPIYLIAVALGFAALENALFLIKPISTGETTVGLLIGQFRFLGSTLLHTVSSGMLGMALGLSIHMRGLKKKTYVMGGLLLAIALHSIFNFFIIKVKGDDLLGIFKVFAFLWVVTIIVMLLFEKVRRMN